ncbi:MAG: calcium-binding protein [Xenococcus sp. (in: cyanobacteria)]
MANGTNVNFFGSPFADNTGDLFLPDGLAGNDILEGDAGNDILNGLDGIDQIKGEQGNDELFGGFGADSLFGGTDQDTIFGEQGNDYAEGGFGDDLVNGNDGNDTLWGDNASTLVPPVNPANNLIIGQNLPVLDGDDIINGGLGNDIIDGEGGNDLLSGNEDDDIINGGFGSDTLVGGLGSDTLTGGDGFDVFKFSPTDSLIGTDIDIITDFDVNQDRIDLTDFVLGGIDGNTQFAFDDFSNGMTQNLASAFYQVGADVIIGSKPELGYNLGSLGTAPLNQSQIVIQNVNIDDLGGFNFIFTPEISDTIEVVV